MLYDKRWDKQTKADPFNLESLIAWLEKKQASKSYPYIECRRCLIGQYMASCGLKYLDDWSYTDACRKIFGAGTASAEVLAEKPYTFGAALTRARAALPLSQRGEK